MNNEIDGPVATELVGEVWPAAHPGNDPVLYGHVELAPRNPVEVRSAQTFRLTYTVGRYGLDDTGAIRIVFRALGDWGRLQIDDPAADNYVSAETDNGVPLVVDYSRYGTSPRPRWKALTVRVMGGYLREGDIITVTLGDTRGGSRGMLMQTFAEGGFEFKVLADVCAVGHFVPITDTPSVAVVPGPPVRWLAVLPTLRRPGDTFRFGLKAEDAWGNPTDRASGDFTFETTMPVTGLPASFSYPRGTKSHAFDDLTVDHEGTLRITVRDADGIVAARSNPLVVRHGRFAGYWGDLHGQSGESIGVTTARQYFDFARNKAFLDVTSHQANDFQVNNAFWSYLNELTAETNDPGTFVTFPGYEWSGNTAVGGDRNIYFRHEGRQIRRSSHALLTDRSDIDTDAADANKLFAALSAEDCLAYAHVGGRYADTAFAHDPRIETAMEIHSAWGTFEWLLTDGFALGHRCGVVCNSDGHKGRPGASYPGASTFGAYGGLTCFLAADLTRDGIFDSLRRRHHYGTTGNRLYLDVQVTFSDTAEVYDRDPAAFADARASAADSAMMGDIVRTSAERATLSIEAVAAGPIERIEVRNGTDAVENFRPYGPQHLGGRVRVLWSGAEYRGRGRDTSWQGTARFDGAEIVRMEKINAWNPERRLDVTAPDTVTFDAITTGNYGGFDVWLDRIDAATLRLDTNHGAAAWACADLGLDGQAMDAGGLKREVVARRLPDRLDAAEVNLRVPVTLKPEGDNPLWVSVYTEDGFQAWSSPIFVFR